jgi:hypothetical protein
MFTMLPVMEMLPWFGITCWPTLLASMKETGERYNVLHFAKKLSARLQFVHLTRSLLRGGLSPLHLAAINDCLDVARLLVVAGARVNMQHW